MKVVFKVPSAPLQLSGCRARSRGLSKWVISRVLSTLNGVHYPSYNPTYNRLTKSAGRQCVAGVEDMHVVPVCSAAAFVRRTVQSLRLP